MESQVCDQVSCPICFEFPSSEIYQCTQGHTICSVCIVSVASCPQCRQPYGDIKIRNRALESLRDSIAINCSYKEFGCAALIPLNEKNKHEETCSFKPEFVDVCNTLGYMCGFKTNVNNLELSLVPHLEKVHGAICQQGSSHNFLYGDFISGTASESSVDSLWNPIIVKIGPCDQDDKFLITSHCSYQDNTMSWSCLRLTNLADENVYHVKLCIRSPSEKVDDFTWSIPCVNLRKAAAMKFVENRPIRISTSFISRYYMETENLNLFMTLIKDSYISRSFDHIEPTWSYTVLLTKQSLTKKNIVTNELTKQRLMPKFLSIYCDNCKSKLLVGVRFKCLQCLNYDLCANCMKQFVHPHSSHVFAIVTTEEQNTFLERYARHGSGQKILLGGKDGVSLSKVFEKPSKESKCNACYTTIPTGGIRYKCLQCRKYLMCKRCLDTGAHNLHIFAFIRTAKDDEFIREMEYERCPLISE